MASAKGKIDNTLKLKGANRRGAALFPDLEKELACWIKENHQGGFGVLTNVILLKAKVLAQKSGLPEGKFRASKSWC